MPSIDLSILVARLGFGCTMLMAHGLPKIQNYSSLVERFADPFGLGPGPTLIMAIFTEVACSLLVIFGFFSRIGSLGLIITMLVAFFVVHGGDPFSRKELSFLFLIGFTTLFISGAGSYSVQNFFKISSSSRLPFVSWLSR